MKKDKPNAKVDDKLSHLANSEIIELILKYYNGEKATDLVEEYHIDITPSQLYKTFPPEVCQDKICPFCNVPMLRNRHSKSSMNYSNNIAYCLNCGHEDYSFCNCNNCKRQRELAKIAKEQELQIIDVQKRKLIIECYNPENYSKIGVDDLSFRDKVYLGALLRLALAEDMTHILPLEKIDRNLSPTPEYAQRILSDLKDGNIIHVSPISDINAFPDSTEDIKFPNTYYTYKVAYDINIDFEGDEEKQLIGIINPKEICLQDKDDALTLWKEVALEECIEYFKIQMDKVKFEFNVGEKTISVFQDLLQHFSVSQIYGIIFKSVANGTRYYQESNVTRKQAANSVIGGCQRYGEKAIVSNWDLSKYHRDYDIPQSMISEFLYNRVLKIGDLGFDMPSINL